MCNNGNRGGSTRRICFKPLVSCGIKKPVDENGARKMWFLGRPAKKQHESVKNPGFLHFQEGIWSNLFQTSRCMSHGPANTKHRIDSKWKSEKPIRKNVKHVFLGTCHLKSMRWELCSIASWVFHWARLCYASKRKCCTVSSCAHRGSSHCHGIVASTKGCAGQGTFVSVHIDNFHTIEVGLSKVG